MNECFLKDLDVKPINVCFVMILKLMTDQTLGLLFLYPHFCNYGYLLSLNIVLSLVIID